VAASLAGAAIDLTGADVFAGAAAVLAGVAAVLPGATGPAGASTKSPFLAFFSFKYFERSFS
jgi:hypothetical protein